MRALIAAVAAALAYSAPAAAHSLLDNPNWGAEPWIVGLLIFTGALYARGVYALPRSAGAHPRALVRHAAAFALGWLTLAIALGSPLAAATAGLFSAHMVQHELMMVTAAPLLVLGRPLAVWTWALQPAWRPVAAQLFRGIAVRSAWRAASAPIAATAVHAVAIWAWHVPALFDLAQTSEATHALQHATFLSSALLFWWAMLRPGREGRLGAAVLCLFATMLHTAALGVLLTFSTHLWYPLATSGAAAWGLTPVEDQQLGGVLMWIPGGFPYVVAALALAARPMRRRRGETGDIAVEFSAR